VIEVMIVDDDPMVRKINSNFLESIEGFNLAKAVSNLKEAKQFLIDNKVNLILLDVFLNNENGIDFFKWIRKEEIHIDVILITADNTMERVQEAFRYGAVDYLIKPFSFDRFKEALGLFKERYHKFKNYDTIQQNELDNLILSSKSCDKLEKDNMVPLEKGFNKYTYNAILDTMERDEYSYFTAEELAEKLAIARVTVRRYLDYMKKEDILDKITEYGKVGRPQHKYKVKLLYNEKQRKK
jgi:Response regulator of citrate/malate metabolism